MHVHLKKSETDNQLIGKPARYLKMADKPQREEFGLWTSDAAKARFAQLARKSSFIEKLCMPFSSVFLLLSFQMETPL